MGRKKKRKHLKEPTLETYREDYRYPYNTHEGYSIEEVSIASESEYTWDSGAEYFDELVIQVPIEFLALLRKLEEEIYTEFAFLLKIEEDLPYIKIVDWYFPRQKVSMGDVEILERKEGFEGVIHKHPGGVKSFSSIDWEYLNKNYKLSLIYCDGNITDCAYKVKIEDKYTWLTRFRVEYIMKGLNIEELLSKIEEDEEIKEI